MTEPTQLNEAAQLWIFGGIFAALIGLGGILWRHMMTCSEKVAVPLAQLTEQFKQTERFIIELREMKHMRVDPYLPRAFDELEGRVRKLEGR